MNPDHPDSEGDARNPSFVVSLCETVDTEGERTYCCDVGPVSIEELQLQEPGQESAIHGNSLPIRGCCIEDKESSFTHSNFETKGYYVTDPIAAMDTVVICIDRETNTHDGLQEVLYVTSLIPALLLTARSNSNLESGMALHRTLHNAAVIRSVCGEDRYAVIRYRRLDRCEDRPYERLLLSSYGEHTQPIGNE